MMRPNFRMFEQHCTIEKLRLSVYHWGVWLYFGYFQKKSILKTPQHCQCCLNCIQILYSGRYELVLPVIICFIKINVSLSDILASQKCIKWGWCIIRGWMTVMRWGNNSPKNGSEPILVMNGWTNDNTGEVGGSSETSGEWKRCGRWWGKGWVKRPVKSNSNIWVSK